jgi:hypothetical protein
MTDTSGNGNNRINVSEDKLDAKLARLELNLVDRITKAIDIKADQAYVEQLHARIHTVESTLQATAMMASSSVETRQDFEKRLRYIERFRFAVPSAAFLSLVAGVAAIVLTYLH